MTITATERAAAQAYLRLLESTQAVLTDPGLAPYAGMMLTNPMAEADEALRAAGLAGNEDRLLRLVSALRSPAAPDLDRLS
ncbi:hypothetical protein ACFFSH_19745 [Streptomyces filamentosus]|uniref:Uncharacterized protein n=1 Tax=Streptomyces filamentosus TaxID=67294 RepID=A0A919BTU6_STRFL|nr:MULTISPECIES: hypothetical protein [Streptomyces]KAA6216127.1 hypothetical protein CP979_03580 [Streptomyces filamentosus]GHG09863.1 hypothetical protein GCM10017667_47940 [Streptomyces filamentosus]